MTALAANKARKSLLNSATGRVPVGIGLAASAKLYAGSLVSVNSSGYAVAGRATATDKVLGVSRKLVDNTGGSAGDVTAKEIETGTFLFANSSSSDEITAADIGAWCYVVDDNTVAKTDNSSARPKAGRIAGVDSSGVWVEVGVHPV